MAKVGILGYENKVIANFFLDEDEEIECHVPFGCGWKGTIKDCKESEISSRRNEGYEYKCPKCHGIIKIHRFIYYD